MNKFTNECDNIRKEITEAFNTGTESPEVITAKLDILARLMDARINDLDRSLIS